MAREIAQHDAGDLKCNDAIARAILESPEHELVLSRDGTGNLCVLVYRNEFGPTCTLDDIFDRMTLMDWRRVVEHAAARAVSAVSGRRFAVPRLRVSVTLRPGEHPDVIGCVELSFYANRRVYEALLRADEAKQKADKRNK